MTVNPDSILDSTKQYLGIDPDNISFDVEVALGINAAFGSLLQLGISTVDSFELTDNTTLWSTYFANMPLRGMSKLLVFQKVRLAFDPPATSFGLEAIQNQIANLEWRVNVAVEALFPPSDPLPVPDYCHPDSPEVDFSSGAVFITSTDPGSVPDGSIWFDTESQP